MQEQSKKQEYRSLFGHTGSGLIYMNHASISPQPTKVTEVIQAFLADRHSGTIENFGTWMETVEETRELAGQLLHTSGTDRITFTSNTSDGLSAVANGLPWQPGDEILLNTAEFPANIQPFRILEKKGVKPVYANPGPDRRITPELLEAHITPKTRMISISAVQYLTGFRADLQSIGALCKKHNLLFVVDGIQGLGAIDIDVEACGIDAIATGCHKWLMAPMGTGFLWLSDKLAARLEPYKTGWLSVENPWELSNFTQNWLPVPKHLETGTFNTMGIIGLHASLKTLLDISIPSIEKEIAELTGYLFDRLSKDNRVTILSPGEKKSRSGIVSFSIRGSEKPDKPPESTDPARAATPAVHAEFQEPGLLVESLKEKDIRISAREGYFRISPHFYNTVEEIDIVLQNLLPS